MFVQCVYCMYISLYVMATSHGTSVCWFFVAQECACFDIRSTCVLVMVSRSTGMCFTVLVIVSHSACVCWQFSQYVCVLVMLPLARVCA